MAGDRKANSKNKEEKSTEVGPVFGGAVAMKGSSALAAAMQASAVKDPRGSAGDSDYLNFSGKQGTYLIGSKQEAVDPDELWVVNISSFEDGWICWKNGKPVATRLANISDANIPAPDMDEFGPFDGDGDGWFQAKAFVLRSVDTGQQGYFKINSISGVSVFADLQKSIAEKAERGEAAWPVVCLDVEKFTAKGYKNFKPAFDIQGWLNDEQIESALGSEEVDINELMNASNMSLDRKEADDEPEEKPTGRRSRRSGSRRSL